MQKFSDWEKSMQKDLMKKKETNYTTCTKCGCQYFEEVEASMFNQDVVVVPGQKAPKTHMQHFLRCVRCAEIFEPMITYNPSTPEGKVYDAFRATMEGVGDLRKKTEEKKE